MTTLDHLTDDIVAGRPEAAGEPTWLRDRRLEAAKRFIDQEWPNSRLDEYWRSTNFKRFKTDVELVTEAGGTADDLPRDGLTANTEHAAIVRIWDGGIVDLRVGTDAAASGLVVADLAEAAVTHEELVKRHLGSLTTTNAEGTGRDEDRTITANDAAWGPGVLVHIPAEVELAGPVGIRIHVTTPGAHLPRVLVVAEHHARGAIYVEHTSTELAAPTTVDEVVEVILGDSAHVDVVSLQEWQGDQVGHLSLQKAAVGDNATFRHLAVNIGGRTVRLRPEADMVGQGGMARPLGVYFADEGQHFDLQPYIRHIAPRATSDVLYKGALQGKSRTIFRGNILVEEGAVGTDTNETNRTLLLSGDARADSTPFLEIFCADITAGHGSATGQIDEDYLFYLAARGIPREEAVRLIVYGFFAEVIDEMDLPGVRERALEHIEREIEAADLDALAVRTGHHAPGAEVA